MAFVKSPDGISVELLQKGEALKPKNLEEYGEYRSGDLEFACKRVITSQLSIKKKIRIWMSRKYSNKTHLPRRWS